MYFLNWNAISDGEMSTSNTSSMPEYPFIKEYYKEIVLPFKPKDKQIVWCWNNYFKYCKELRFYDAENNCTFTNDKGKRGGMEYDHYAPYKGPKEPWMDKALSHLVWK